MANKPQKSAPTVHLKKQLVVAAVLLVIAGVVIIVVGKLVIGGLLSLLGAVFGLGAQVAADIEL